MPKFAKQEYIGTLLYLKSPNTRIRLPPRALKQLASEPEDGSVAGCFFVCKNLYVIGRLLVCVAEIDVN